MIAVLALVLVIALAACARVQPGPIKPQHAGPAGGGFHGGMQPGAFASLTRLLMPPGFRDLEKLGLALSLTDQQRAAIKDLYKTFGTTMKQIAPTRAADLKAALGVMQSPSPSKDALLAANAKVQQDDNAILSAEFDFWVGLRGILNQQQQAAVQSFMLQRFQREVDGGPRQGPTPSGTVK